MSTGKPVGWDERDYKLASQVRQLPSFGIITSNDRMVSMQAVLDLLEKQAKSRAAEAGPQPREVRG